MDSPDQEPDSFCAPGSAAGAGQRGPSAGVVRNPGIIRGIGLLAVSLLSVAGASADMQVKLYDSFGNTNGGEFDADSVGSTPIPFVSNISNNGRDFVTFCVERTEFISFGTRYDVLLNTAAVRGGVIDGGSDPLDPRSAYLYTNFANGVLSNYNYASSGTNQAGLTRVASANALQNVLWYIEGEIQGPLSGQAQTWLNEAAAAVAIGGSWYDQWGPNSIGNVRVMNLYKVGHAGDTNFGAQDQLVMVPAPGAALLGVIGLAVVAPLRRRLSAIS